MRKHLAAFFAVATLVLVPSAIAVASYTWTNVGVSNELWYAAAMSDSGSIAYSAKGDFVSPYEAHLWKSTNGGESWSELTSSPDKKTWRRIVTSGDGSKVAAIGYGHNSYSEYLWLSNNGGSTWTSVGGQTREWFDVAMSRNGSVLVATNKSMSDSDGGVWRSTDGGVNWTDVTPVVSSAKVLGFWRSVSVSSDGQRILAGLDFRGLFLSVDGGANWVEHVPISGGVFTDVAMSGDGRRMLAAVDIGASGEDGVWVSRDFGATWSRTLAMTAITNADISRDGTTMVAARYPRTDTASAVYASRDGGASWQTEPAPQAAWTGLALNESGERMILMAEYDISQFATSTTTTTTTTTSTTVAPATTAATTTTSSSTTTATVPPTTVVTTTSAIVDSPPPAVTPSMVETFKPKPLVKDEQVAAGETVTVRISGFQPFELVSIGFDDGGGVTSQAVGDPVRAFAGRKVLTTVRADATGTISVQTKLPASVSGPVTLWAYGRESKVGFRQKFTVAELPATGSQRLNANLTLAGSLVVSGAVLFGLRRRLRR